MKSELRFNALNGCKNVSREEITEVIDIAKEENNCDVVYRLSKVLNDQPKENYFNIAVASYPDSGLNGAKHTGDYKEALDDCGRLRKGFHFVAGKVVKVETKPKPTPTPKPNPHAKKIAEIKSNILKLKKKYALGNSYAPGLHGVSLADGVTILTDDESRIYDNEEYLGGLNASAKEVEEIVNELILNVIKTGEKLPPWKQSWAKKTKVLAQNFVTKKPYSGSNSTILNVLLGSIMPTPYYLTASQITTLKGQIKKGAKSIPLVYYNFTYQLKNLASNPSAEIELLKKINGYEVKRKGKKSVFLSKTNYAGVTLNESEINYLELEKNEYISKGYLLYYRVFNIADTTGIDYEIPNPENRSEGQRINLAEKVIKGFKDIPKIVFGGDDATYNTKTDIINMPNIGDFDKKEEYYTTLFHEMIHSTLHESRLNREEQYKGKREDSQYAFEELIAELGASYLAGVCGILDVVYLNSASYLKNWHERLQKLTETNSDFFVYATKEAQKAVDYILQGFNEAENEDTENDNEMLELEAQALKLKLKLKIKAKINQK